MVNEQETTVTDETRYFLKKFGVGGAKAPFSPHVAPPLHMIWLRKFILFFLESFNL